MSKDDCGGDDDDAWIQQIVEASSHRTKRSLGRSFTCEMKQKKKIGGGTSWKLLLKKDMELAECTHIKLQHQGIASYISEALTCENEDEEDDRGQHFVEAPAQEGNRPHRTKRFLEYCQL